MNISLFRKQTEWKGPKVMIYVVDESRTVESSLHFLDDPEPRHFSFSHMRSLLFSLLSFFLLSGIIGIIFVLDPFPATIQLYPAETTQHGQLQLSFSPTSGSQIVRMLSVTKKVSDHAQTTGLRRNTATGAVGILTWYNATNTSYYLPAGLQFSTSDGQRIQTTSATTLPIGGLPTASQATVNAQVLQPGSQGNIAAQAINVQCPCDLGLLQGTLPSGVSVTNRTPFSGGANSTSYATVTAHDINPTKVNKQSTQQSLTELEHQYALGDHQIISPHCISTNQADHSIGEQAQQVTITSTTTCSVEVYNAPLVQQQAATQWYNQVQYTLPSWTCITPVAADITSATLQLQGIVTILVDTSGTWKSHITIDVISSLKSQMVGKTHQQVLKILASLKGIGHGPIQQFGGGLFHFPQDKNRIVIDISPE
jgi:Baseplate J-like protein